MNPTPAQLIAHLAAAGHRPTALVGEWFGFAAVVAPDAVARPLPLADAFPSPGPLADDAATASAAPPAPWNFGWIPYAPPEVEPVAFAASTRDVIVFDGAGWRIPEGSGVDPEWLDRVLADAARSPLPRDPDVDWDDGDRAAHERGVLDCLESIRAGDVYQACLSTRFYGKVAVDGAGGSDDVRPAAESECPASTVAAAAAWFARRVERFSPTRAAFVTGVEGGEAGSATDARATEGTSRVVAIASLSPEEFLVRNGAVVRESPIKGTLPLSADPAALAASKKDVAENIMIVDLVRHDLGQVAVTGGVRVTDLLAVRPAPGVWHLVSEVTAELPDGLTHHELISACYPPASVTGTPKIRAAELIDGWEPVGRGVHCGAVGASMGDRLELNVAIRTAEFRDAEQPIRGTAEFRDATSPNPGANENAAHVTVEAGVGGGITIDSDPGAEWDEIIAKAAPLRDRC